LGGNLKEIDHVEYPDTNKRIILRRIFGKWNGEALTGLIRVRRGTGGGLL
jgi:hypothetical protein